MSHRRSRPVLAFAVLFLALPTSLRAQAKEAQAPTELSPAAFVSPAFPSGLVAATAAPRIAWIA